MHPSGNPANFPWFAGRINGAETVSGKPFGL